MAIRTTEERLCDWCLEAADGDFIEHVYRAGEAWCGCDKHDLCNVCRIFSRLPSGDLKITCPVCKLEEAQNDV